MRKTRIYKKLDLKLGVLKERLFINTKTVSALDKNLGDLIEFINALSEILLNHKRKINMLEKDILNLTRLSLNNYEKIKENIKINKNN